MSSDKVKCKGRVPIAIINILEMNDPGIEISKDVITGPCECTEGGCIGRDCKCDTCIKYDTMQEITCVFCKKTYEVHYNQADMGKWIGQLHIQKASPYLNATDLDFRELLQTKMCGECWDETFKE